MLRWRQWFSVVLPLMMVVASVVSVVATGTDLGFAALIRPQDGVPFWF
jgi:hypothetical protein